MFNQAAPSQQLDQYARIIGGMPNFGTSTTTMPAGGGLNPLMGGLGGAATGAYIGTQVGNPVIGAGLGGLIGLLGSRR